MNLTKEQLTQLFNCYLKEYFLLRSFNHLPQFNNIEGGAILTRRLFKILRNENLKHLVTGETVNIIQAFEEAKKFLLVHKRIYLVGLNDYMTIKDLEVLRELYEKLFF